MNPMLRIAICEDLPDEAADLRQMIMDSDTACEVAVFENGEAFWGAQPAGSFQLVFLDVYMGGMTGVEVARRLREAGDQAQLVFTTTSEDFALEGFRVHAMQYLVKPVCREDVTAVLSECRRRIAPQPDTVRLPVEGGHRDIPFAHILYAEVYNYDCYIHLTGEVIKVRMTLDDVAALLPRPDFLRCHRAYVVNLAHAVDIGRDFIMKNGDTVYIRRGDVAKCAKTYKEYLMDRAGRDS